ncbi:MAG TPA: transglutaminase domain-containing protein [Dehalococcoidia bacterium]|nr:transglutaminase domain-containing protein [Dehalococcoidia bacterium]
MRQASWEEVFRAREASQQTPPRKKRPAWQRTSFISWEELVTFAIVLIAFITVVESINGADWVPEMPSLYPVAFLGLIVGLVLARSSIPGPFAHLLALGIGAVGVAIESTAKLPGPLQDRVSELGTRLNLWTDALLSGGISNDNLPFVVLVVSASFLMAYISAWGIFRWYNAWVGLIPSGLALLTNISYLPGQKSVPLLIYLFCAILLVARVNLLRSARKWRREGTRYPDFISLHVLNVTVWVGLGLLALAWVLPVGHGSGLLYSAWTKVTSPVAGPVGGLGRVFSAIDSKKGGTVHRFGATLPLQGEISLGGGEVMVVTSTETGFLRAQVYDQYIGTGWKVGPASQITTGSWPASKALIGADEAAKQQRRPVSLQVTASRDANVIVAAGTPLQVSIDSRVVSGADQTDVTSLRPTGTIHEGDQYRVDSAMSSASQQALRKASSVYPSSLAPYLQLPGNLPQNIGRKAREVTRDADNNYDKAAAIEQFLRTFAVDTKINPAPPNRDSVDYFLNSLGRGYFDYHASAMVVMLRTLGIPSRLSVGYVLRVQDRLPDSNIYVVTDANSFAWPEVYFPGLGWVEFNPTPSEPRITRADVDVTGAINPLEQFFEDQGTPLGPGGESQSADAALAQLELKEDNHLVSRIIFSIILVVLAVTAIGFGAFQYSWQRGLSGVGYPVQVWEKTLRLARWAKIRPQPQETPRELVDRLKVELPEVKDLDYLGEQFIRARYGQKELTPDEKERLQAVWGQTRRNLLQRILRWK